MSKHYISGLDLGKVNDPTALCVLEYDVDEPAPAVVITDGPMGRQYETTLQRPQSLIPPKSMPRDYRLRHLERYALGTDYPIIIDKIVALFANQPIAWSVLVVDHTGPGIPVVDFLRKARPRCVIRPVSITCGAGWKLRPDGGYNVSKKELVSVMNVLTQSPSSYNPDWRRLQMPTSRLKDMPLVPVLIKELSTFVEKKTLSLNETFAADREGEHDDLLLALACACWIAEKGTQQLWVR